MFDQNQKRTLRIALMAIIVGFVLSMFGGCDGVGQATDVDAGVATGTATTTSTASSTATTTASFTTTVTATFTANTTVTTSTIAGTTVTYTSVTVSTRPVINVNNPCVTATGCTQHVNNGMQVVNLVTCGWDSAAGTCYTTLWCEASVASIGMNAAYGPCEGAGPACPVEDNVKLTDTLVRLRPRSAVCSLGSTYTFKAGALMVWGAKASGSLYSSAAIHDDGYICVPRSEDITVNC